MSRDFDALQSWLALNGWRIVYLSENRPGLWIAKLASNDRRGTESPCYSRDTAWQAIRECVKKEGIKPVPLALLQRLDQALSELTSELEKLS